MKQALFLNGVYEDVLLEIISSQSRVPGLICYLQPYKGEVIKLLKALDPSEANPVTLYASGTKSLDVIHYTGAITGWMDKRELGDDADRLRFLNEHIQKHQPNERRIYFYTDDDKTKMCVNLIAVKNLRKVQTPFPVTTLVKISDGKPHRVRSRSGGWSPVHELPSWVGVSGITTRDQLDIELETNLEESTRLTAEARRERLENACPNPVPVQVISMGFRRNPDVIVEVLARARGKCEQCQSDAPFKRAKDGSPYLEIHHKKPLSLSGQDTVENAIAVCPNCHMRFHYGITDPNEGLAAPAKPHGVHSAIPSGSPKPRDVAPLSPGIRVRTNEDGKRG